MPNNAPQSAVALSRVYARFEDEPDVLALKDVSFSIKTGSFVSIVGPSGSGKSTLMRIILGLMKPSSGTVVRNFARPGMVFQNYALFPWLSALDNVAYGLHMQDVPKKQREKIAQQKLEEVGLHGLGHRFPNALSGGQRQRVGLARALAISPDLLIMDEPFSNLDTITAQGLKADLLRIWRDYGLTVIMVNHLLPDAIELSDDILILKAHPGEIVRSVPVTLTRPRDTRSDSFYRAVDALTEQIRSIS